MMAQKIDHWEALFDKSYMRWFDLNGEPALVEIVSVDGHVEMTLPGGAKTRKPVVKFKLIQGKIDPEPAERGEPVTYKPLVLNATNGNTIAEIHGPKPSAWPGKRIVLFQDNAKMYDKEQKKMVVRECIRIRAPKS